MRKRADIPSRVESHRATQAEQNADHLFALIQHSNDFIAMAGLDGGILFINRGGRKLLGLSPDMDVADLKLKDFHTDQGLTRAAILKQHGHWEGEGQLRHFHTGELIDVHVSSFLMRTPSGAPMAFATVQRDLREHKRLESRLRQVETMSALGQLLAGVAHEVRNPLFAISAMLDAMEVRFEPASEHRTFLTALRNESNRLNAVMRDLLEYGRPQEEALEVGALAPIVEQSLRDCAGSAERAGVRLESTVDASLRVRLNALRLTQVFQNLLENAIQHTPAGGSVRFRAELRSDPAPFVECKVIDGGVGFREEDLPHVFEPFFTRRPGGTGLGLSIVQRIVVQHGGDVWAENRGEGGGQVIVRLPKSLPE